MVDSMGTCSRCDEPFPYHLIHNGFNNSAYAYCDACGTTALFDTWQDDIPAAAGLVAYARILPSVEPFLAPCGCGGSFTARAGPRCPACSEELDAEAARAYIEFNAPGTANGWRWQGNWYELYAIIVAGQVVSNPWKHRQILAAPEA
jgi:hypothetical protein